MNDDKTITAICVSCDEPNILPDKTKVFECSKCKLGQTVTVIRNCGYSHNRNYPEGFWR